MTKARLLCVMDPMYSWCWGSAPVVKMLSQQMTADGIALHLVADSLRIGHGAVLDPNTRDYILGHWQTVQQTTDQPFCFDDTLPESFVYNAEPACRALVTARSLDEESAWSLVRVIQRAFYTEGRDVTQVVMLADLAGAVGIPHTEFAAVFGSGEACDAATADFVWVQDLDITGLLTLLAGHNGQLALPTNGYQPLAELSSLLGRWLERDRHEWIWRPSELGGDPSTRATP